MDRYNRVVLKFDASAAFDKQEEEHTHGSIAYYVHPRNNQRRVLYDHCEKIQDISDNMYLEYLALKKGLELCTKKFDKQTELYIEGDCKNVIRCIDPEKKDEPSREKSSSYVFQIKNFLSHFELVHYNEITREQNRIADNMANNKI